MSVHFQTPNPADWTTEQILEWMATQGSVRACRLKEVERWIVEIEYSGRWISGIEDTLAVAVARCLVKYGEAKRQNAE